MKMSVKLFSVIPLLIAGYTSFAQAPVADSFPVQTDYSKLSNWAAHPWKKDPSDSVPAPLRKDYRQDSSVDVFFIHPTTYTNRERPFGWNAPVDDSLLNKKTDETTILYQASIFNEAGRVFAPRYRQANLSAYFTQDTATALAAFDTAYEDVKAAFQYYLDHYNNGRPIIIASHSQGTTHAKRLLKEFFDGTALQHQLVAAYLVGMAVEPDCFASIHACTTPDETGCVCSWRTFKEDFEPLYVQQEKFTAVVTNPLTWKINEPVASRSENKGAVLLKFNKIIPHPVNAEVHNGVLWVEKPRFFGNVFYTNKNYHIGDYNLFYINVRENAEERIGAFENVASNQSR
ncbi:MAG TPA: DUF3089 domain-containing protein [Parafilimonas sp.]|nr:DUF3089 domain-containing protein [Parafilimonas sp.]